MVNKIRKKDGNLKYPYQMVLSFVNAEELFQMLKCITNCAYRDNKSYGVFIYGYTHDNEIRDKILKLFKEYFPDFKVEVESDYMYIKNDFFSYHIYIAYSEFDKEV